MSKDWVLTIGIQKFYITEKQKDFYLKSVQEGQKFVVLDETKVLGTNFQTLVHSSELDITKQLDTGKWTCDKGKVHAKGAVCMCGKHYEIGTDGIGRLVDGDEPERLESGE